MPGRGGDHAVARRRVRGEGLFAQDGHAGAQRAKGMRLVETYRRRHDGEIERDSFEKRFVRVGGRVGKRLAKRGGAIGVGIKNRREQGDAFRGKLLEGRRVHVRNRTATEQRDPARLFLAAGGLVHGGL